VSQERRQKRAHHFLHCGNFTLDFDVIELQSQGRYYSSEELQEMHRYRHRDGLVFQERHILGHCGLTRLCVDCDRRVSRQIRERWIPRGRQALVFRPALELRHVVLSDFWQPDLSRLELYRRVSRKIARRFGEACIWFEEMKYQVRRDQVFYYPHYHLLFFGGWIPEKSIKAQWRQASQSGYVHIEQKPQGQIRDQVRYMTKYITKPLQPGPGDQSLDNFTQGKLDVMKEAYARASYKRHLATGYGLLDPRRLRSLVPLAGPPPGGRASGGGVASSSSFVTTDGSPAYDYVAASGTSFPSDLVPELVKLYWVFTGETFPGQEGDPG